MQTPHQKDSFRATLNESPAGSGNVAQERAHRSPFLKEDPAEEPSDTSDEESAALIALRHGQKSSQSEYRQDIFPCNNCSNQEWHYICKTCLWNEYRVPSYTAFLYSNTEMCRHKIFFNARQILWWLAWASFIAQLCSAVRGEPNAFYLVSAFKKIRIAALCRKVDCNLLLKESNWLTLSRIICCSVWRDKELRIALFGSGLTALLFNFLDELAPIFVSAPTLQVILAFQCVYCFAELVS